MSQFIEALKKGKANLTSISWGHLTEYNHENGPKN